MERRTGSLRPAHEPGTADACESLLRPCDVARTLNIGKRTLERWLSSGQFPRPDIKAGKKISLWRPRTVQAWIETQTRTQSQGKDALP